MRRIVIVVLAAFVLLALSACPRPEPVQIAQNMGQIERVLDALERTERLLVVNTAEIQRINKAWEKDKRQIEALTAEIKQLKSDIQASEPIFIPVGPPEAAGCDERLSGYIDITKAQGLEIGRLNALNTKQGIIIERQDEIIHKQTAYINQFDELLKQHQRRANRNAIIGVAVGIVVGLII